MVIDINYPTAIVIATGLFCGFTMAITFMVFTFRLIKKGLKEKVIKEVKEKK